MYTIKDHILGYHKFIYYRDSSLWYKAPFTDLIYPVPISDIGNGTFKDYEKGILMMRYIRKHLKELEDAK